MDHATFGADMYSSTPTPWSILSSTVGVGVLTDGWTLDKHGKEPGGIRSFVVDVNFVSPFAAVPVVHLGITGFDADQRESSRLTVKVASINEFGFQATVSTWSDSRVYSVEFNWMAIGA